MSRSAPFNCEDSKPAGGALSSVPSNPPGLQAPRQFRSSEYRYDKEQANPKVQGAGPWMVRLQRGLKK